MKIKIKTITFMMGLPGSGKSTWIGKNMAGATVVSPDTYKEGHKDYNRHTGGEELYKWSTEKYEEERKERMEKGESMILDRTGSNKEELEKRIREAKEKGYRTEIVWVHADSRTATERNRKRYEQGGRYCPEFTTTEEAYMKIATSYVHNAKIADVATIA